MGEIRVYVRSSGQFDRTQSKMVETGFPFVILDQKNESGQDCVSINILHRAKGPEFRVVTVLACDDEVIPLQERIETVSDESDLRKTYDTERHLLYVACTRARDYLLVTGVAPASEFQDDLRV